MTIDWNAVLNGTIVFVLLVFLKFLLDFKVAVFIVKYFSWMPIRNYFREKPIKISGQWEQIWESANSVSYKNETDRHSHPVIKQLGCYCYSEFFSKEVTYVVFGRIVGEYFVGD